MTADDVSRLLRELWPESPDVKVRLTGRYNRRSAGRYYAPWGRRRVGLISISDRFPWGDQYPPDVLRRIAVHEFAHHVHFVCVGAQKYAKSHAAHGRVWRGYHRLLEAGATGVGVTGARG